MSSTPVRGTKLTTPSDTHVRVLRAILRSPGPVRSAELEQHAGLFTAELRAACRWLKENGYVTCKLKRVQQQVSYARVRKALAFWSVTDKARAYLANADGAVLRGSPERAPASPLASPEV